MSFIGIFDWVPGIGKKSTYLIIKFSRVKLSKSDCIIKQSYIVPTIYASLTMAHKFTKELIISFPNAEVHNLITAYILRKNPAYDFWKSCFTDSFVEKDSMRQIAFVAKFCPFYSIFMKFLENADKSN